VLAAHALNARTFVYEPASELIYFARTPARAQNIDQLTGLGPAAPASGFTAASGLTLDQATWTQPEYHTGETLHLFLYWHNRQGAGTYAFALRLAVRMTARPEEIPAELVVSSTSPATLRQQIDFPHPGVCELGPLSTDADRRAGPKHHQNTHNNQ